MDKRLKKGLEFKPDTVILAVGENTPTLETEESRRAFRESLIRMLSALRDNGNPTIVVREPFPAQRDQVRDPQAGL